MVSHNDSDIHLTNWFWSYKFIMTSSDERCLPVHNILFSSSTRIKIKLLIADKKKRYSRFPNS